MRTLVVGIDSATWRVIHPLMQAEKLPNFKKLTEEGVSGILRSTMPPLTPPAWTTIVTGVNPGKHGIWDFVQQDHNTYCVSPLNYRQMNVPAIWDIFNAHQRRVGILNFPLAYPPPEVDSFFVSGISTPDSSVFAFPASLMTTIESRKYRIYPSVAPSAGAKRYAGAVEDMTRVQLGFFGELLEQYDPELAMVIFMGVDWIQHHFWDPNSQTSDYLQSIYRLMDEVLGELIGLVDDDWNILVLSDHGACEIDGVIHLNSLLEDWGYLQRSADVKKGFKRLKRAFVEAVYTCGRRLPFFPKQALKHFLTNDLLNQLLSLHREQFHLHEIIDWGKTTAFSYGNMGRIFINAAGRYPAGIVSAEQYEPVREEIMARLKSLRNPMNREPLIDQVFRREELYQGQALDSAPDILFNARQFRYQFYGDFGKGWFLPRDKRLADHDMEGIFLLKGPNILKNLTLSASVEDITPTLLYLHNLPCLASMDGQVLSSAITEDLLTHQPPRTLKNFENGAEQSSGYNSEEIKQVENRLNNLGYL
ncbi:MAG: alkaline phosphatase family protein [Acidobacteria bacterium]|nr:alkaline phosphatase family protein [Acidobacteriota bacterium]